MLTDPDLVFLLLLLGLAGLGFEIFNPGAIVPGVVGAISLLLALAGMTVLPVPVDRRRARWCSPWPCSPPRPRSAASGSSPSGGVVALALGGAFLFDSERPGAHAPRPWLAAVTAAPVVGGASRSPPRLVLRARAAPAR